MELEKVQIARAPQALPAFVQETPPPKKDKVKDEWKDKFNKRKLKKPKAIMAAYLRNNGRVELLTLESNNGFFEIDGQVKHEDKDCIYRTKDGNPFCVLEEDSIIPRPTEKFKEKSMQVKFAQLQDHVLKGIRNAELVRLQSEQGNKLSVKAWVGIGLVLVIGWAILSGMGVL